MSIIDILKIRYIKPLTALKDDYIPKTIISVAAVVSSSILEIFSVNTELILLLGAAIIADWITGIIAAKRKDVFIRSLGFRQTFVKVIEYAVFLIILSGIANVFGDTTITGWVGDTLRMLKDIDWFGYFYIVFTELKSISENLGGKKSGFHEVIQQINEKIFGEKDDDYVR